MRTLAIVLALIPGLAFPAPVFARSSFNPDEIEATISEFYGIYSATPGPEADGLTEADKLEIADSLGDMVAVLNPNQFNDVLGHLAADYRQNPDHRVPIELLLDLTYRKIAPELQHDREKHPVITVIDKVFLVWTIAYTFRFGKGLWRSRGSGLKGLERFQHVVKTTVAELRVKNPGEFRRILAIGAGIGVAEVIYDYLSTKKLDPRHMLSETQADIVRELAQKMADARKELKTLFTLSKSDPARFRAGAAASRARLAAIDGLASKAQPELQHLYDAASQLRATMEPIAADLRSVKSYLERIGGLLDEVAPIPLPTPPAAVLP